MIKFIVLPLLSVTLPRGAMRRGNLSVRLRDARQGFWASMTRAFVIEGDLSRADQGELSPRGV